ncbi:glycosyltransferase family 2 protein [Mucilaginibacter paludis]|uniref:Glycosyl transferase family 2 n=1 Tax=Mucilaginibacter paludis DSM 18603 TaxID=714943 RepID=H1YHK1_9SPHI|nr:glycosyltransferase family 2 protein [Mucilaginibacter paludis]EHQ26424.1 glycosyl transferase family 2 [Mucilaginibacter paludis DSM 18603]
MESASIVLALLMIAICLLSVLHRVFKYYVNLVSVNYKVPVITAQLTGKKVAILMAIRNEEPSIVFKTLDSMLRQKYENYIIIVVDNNTESESLWKPIEEYCSQNDKLKFVHIMNLKGYKSGALNLALEYTPEDCDYISVIDCDTIVDPSYLSDLMCLFDNPQTNVVLTPSGVQSAMLTQEFTLGLGVIHRYFHSIYMTYAHMKGIVPFIGNMSIVRKSVIEKNGLWDGHYLCEDMELSRRIIMAGSKSQFVDIPYGKTLLPLSLKSAKQQFYRWAFGNAQIFRDNFLRDLFKKPKLALSFYPIPGIHANLFTLPFYCFIVLSLLLHVCGIDNRYLELANIAVFSVFVFDTIGNIITNTYLLKKEKLTVKTAWLGLCFQKALALTFSRGTYSVLINKSMPFKITPHFNEKLQNNVLYNVYKNFKFDTCLSLVVVLLSVFDARFGALNYILIANASFVVLSSVFQVYLSSLEQSELVEEDLSIHELQENIY